VNPPDLRVLAELIALHVGVPANEAKRLRECPEHSLSLVIIRVVMKELKRRSLLTDAEEDSMLAKARPAVVPITTMMPVEQEAKTGATVTVEQVIRGIDVALVSSDTRFKFSNWFVCDFWPGVMQRMAAGAPMSEREQSIARRVLAEVTT
jgi:hypothetical protein